MPPPANALLCIVIDAADNAQMAAEEIGEARSFARDLLREQLPEGLRLVVLGRTHRMALLDPPPNALTTELSAFMSPPSCGVGEHIVRHDLSIVGTASGIITRMGEVTRNDVGQRTNFA